VIGFVSKQQTIAVATLVHQVGTLASQREQQTRQCAVTLLLDGFQADSANEDNGNSVPKGMCVLVHFHLEIFAVGFSGAGSSPQRSHSHEHQSIGSKAATFDATTGL
jgi:hypothetical protein